jgi:hypothetical protein
MLWFMTNDESPKTPRSQLLHQLAPWPNYATSEPLITELEDTLQLCSECGDLFAPGHGDVCPNCTEEHEMARALLAEHERNTNR